MSGKGKTTRKMSVGTIVCIVISVLLLPLFLINVTLVTKGIINDKEPPSIFGYAPLAVTSGSMDDGSKNCIQIGDLIFVKKIDVDKLEVGDVITFDGKNGYVTHRIKEVVYEEGGEEIKYFLTKGDANNAFDPQVAPEDVYGKYVGRVGGLGEFILFLQTPWGILLFVGIPVVVYLAFAFAEKLGNKRRNREVDEKEAEIQRLRAMIAEQSGTPTEEVADSAAEPQTEASVDETPTKEGNK